MLTTETSHFTDQKV